MGNFNKYLDVEPQIADSKDGVSKKITFWGIKTKQEAEKIINRITTPGNSTLERKGLPYKNIKKGWYFTSKNNIAVVLLVEKDKLNDFIDTGLKSVISALVSTGTYNNDAILRLEDVVAHKLEASDSLKDKFKAMSDAEVSVADLWQKYLNNINDPTIREALALYSKIYSNTVYGHALSLANVLRIRAINPDATFVVSESTWNNWGFGIKRGAKKYPMWAPVVKNNVTQQELDDAKNKLGHELDNMGDLGVTVKNAIMIEAQKEANKGKKVSFFPYYGYDIADTYQYNPKEDNPLQSKPNISSNVVYKLNSLAQELENKKRMESGNIDTGLQDKVTKQYTVANDVVSKLCSNGGLNVDSITQSDATPEDKLIHLLSEYYRFLINNKAQENKKGTNAINVLKPENINKYIQDGVQLTLLMNGLPFNQNNFTHSIEYTQNEAATLGNIIKGATEQIGRAITMNEGIGGSNFLNKFKTALNKLGIRIVADKQTEQQPNQEIERIKNNFNEMLNRINNPIIY